ncbi:MAG TPA: alpha/beta fold hydrolase [Thermoanaerobaculia bacterium]|nr:alpha/beta fold hydrolase [Thermoanaerobaculia bacterium]HQN08983.1 alpha/beta fold hydrolase [Thermoanaerobaculia bacterium]
MNRPMKLLLAAAALLVLAAIVFILWARLRPLAAYAAAGRRALAKAGLETARVPSPAGEQTYFRGGSGPVVVLLHGAGDQASAWSLVAPKLLPGRTLVVPDLAGHGASAPEKGAISVPMLLSGLSAVLDAAAPGGKVTIVGNSLGAWLACLWAKEHPERVERLVLVNGGPLKHAAEGITLLPKDRAEARAAVEKLRDPGSIRVPDFVLDDVVRQAATGPLARLAATSGAMEPHVLDGKLGGLDVPVDLLWGASDQLLPLSYAERMRVELPRARVTELPRCGHVPQQECPAAFAAALGKLLDGPPPERAAATPEVP